MRATDPGRKYFKSTGNEASMYRAKINTSEGTIRDRTLRFELTVKFNQVNSRLV